MYTLYWYFCTYSFYCKFNIILLISIKEKRFTTIKPVVRLCIIYYHYSRRLSALEWICVRWRRSVLREHVFFFFFRPPKHSDDTNRWNDRWPIDWIQFVRRWDTYPVSKSPKGTSKTRDFVRRIAWKPLGRRACIAGSSISEYRDTTRRCLIMMIEKINNYYDSNNSDSTIIVVPRGGSGNVLRSVDLARFSGRSVCWTRGRAR